MKLNKRMILVLAVMLVVVATGAFVIQEYTREQINEWSAKEDQGRLNLADRIKLAKATGKTKIKLGGVEPLYPVVDDVDETLSIISVIVAKPVWQEGMLSEDGEIVTWVKCRVLDTLSRFDHDPYGRSPAPPTDIAPESPDEIVIFRMGGTVTIEGVEVTRHELGFPEFENHRSYLLFLSFDPNQPQVARLTLGPDGVFEIDDAGNLKPINARDYNHIHEDLKRHHSESLDLFKSRIQRREPQ